jgi:hypothetical protein
MAQMKKTAVKKAAPKAAPKKAVDNKGLVQDITNRFRVTAREARDIVTAVGTHMQTAVGNQTKKRTGDASGVGPSGKNLARQINETTRAAVTGKAGTTSDVVKVSGPLSAQYTSGYKKGTRRK